MNIVNHSSLKRKTYFSNGLLDDKEKNRTLRANDAQAAAGDAFTQVWEISRLTEYEIKQIVQGFGEQLAQSIMAKAGVHPAFLEIVSRPSMLPVVATIWEKIERLEDEGYSLNSGAIFEEYLKAIFLRKEAEIKKDEQIALAPGSANYLLLPLEVREIFTLLVVWSMASNNSRNTIPRSQFNAAIEQVFDDVFRGLQEQNTQPHITAAIRAFEQQFREDTKADKLERISTEIASAGLFVSDPAGGSSNLRLPHKQYYEYLIAKSAWIILSHENSWLSITLRKIAKNRNTFSILWSEINSLSFFSEIIGLDFSLFSRLLKKALATRSHR